MCRDTEKEHRRFYKWRLLFSLVILANLFVNNPAINEKLVRAESQISKENWILMSEDKKVWPENIEEMDDGLEDIETGEEEDSDLTSTQRNSINMLNYITVLTQQINASKESRIFLESVQSSLLNNIYPNAVDTKTQNQINNLWKIIDEYRMISVKRERLDYIYEQNKAQALKQAIPSPLGLLSTVQSRDLLQAAASVLYMAIDSVTSYQSVSTQTDLKYLQDNWELEDTEKEELSASQLDLFNYMVDMTRDNGFSGDFALNMDSVENFVEWANEENIVSKIVWLEANVDTYQEFRTYWLELAKSYYECGEYAKCLNAIKKYEKVATRIFRKDYDYAKTLPMAILSSKEIMKEKEYVETADKYAGIILDNCSEDEWDLRYFAAQIYIDLYADTEDKQYLEKAYNIVYNNVNILVKEQEKLNDRYLEKVKKEKAGEEASKREKQEIKAYNKLLTEKRKVELPPVNEAFYLNCDLLFALLDELDISDEERKRIDSILHEDGKSIFLTESLDNRFWANAGEEAAKIDVDSIEIEFKGDELVIPASCLTERSSIEVSVSGGENLTDWNVKRVKRSKNMDCSEFKVTLTSKLAKEHKYTAGEKITITVLPITDAPDETIEFTYEVVEKKILKVIHRISFERKMK